MNQRGPSLSMSQPSSGCTHVWNRMNSVNASWMSDSFQPVPACSGWTNSVQAYCRLAIMIIATSDATELKPAIVHVHGPPPRQI